MRQIAYYGFFIALSVVVHFLIIRPPWGPIGARAAAPPPPPDDAIMVEIQQTAEELAAIAKQLPPEPPPPLPPPEPKVEEKKAPEPARIVENGKDEETKLPEMVRLEEERKKLEQEKEEAKRKAEEAERLAEAERRRLEEEKQVAEARERRLEEERKKLEQEKQDLARRLADAKRTADVEAERRIEAERAQAAAAAQAETERRRRAEAEAETRRRAEEAERALAEARAREEAARRAAREKDEELQRRVAQNEDYERLRTQRWDLAGVKAPKLKFDEQGRTRREMAELLRYYKMALVVYTPATRDFLAEVDPATGGFTEIKDPAAYFAPYTERWIVQTGPIWNDYAVSIAAAKRKRPETLGFAVLLKPQIDEHFARMQLEACQRAKRKPDDVAVTVVAYEHDRARGHWNLRIRQLWLQEGGLIDLAAGIRAPAPARSSGG